MSYLCGIDEPVPVFPDTGGTCCMGADRGPQHCACWRPVYAGTQQDPVGAAVNLIDVGITQPDVSDGMCGDCAYRPGSPEKTGDPKHRGDADELERLAAIGKRFWCHQGMRRIEKWVHPSGAEVAGHPADYAPPIIGTTPYRLDGTPALLCAGWRARRKALLAPFPIEVVDPTTVVDGARYLWIGDDGEYLVLLGHPRRAELDEIVALISRKEDLDEQLLAEGQYTDARMLTQCPEHADSKGTDCRFCDAMGPAEWWLDWGTPDGSNAGKPTYFPIVVWSTC